MSGNKIDGSHITKIRYNWYKPRFRNTLWCNSKEETSWNHEITEDTVMEES